MGIRQQNKMIRDKHINHKRRETKSRQKKFVNSCGWLWMAAAKVCKQHH